mmetsp:Transcript_17776/g.30872  ORF Transcript_17776/g.30872 Transcript_17776/m.30872 type:complete len:242 (-) Transcript_17776:831-1556(-)
MTPICTTSQVHDHGLLRFPCQHHPVPWVRLTLGHVYEAHLLESATVVHRIVLVTVRLCGLHQREQYRGQTLYHWALWIVIGERHNASWTQHPEYFSHDCPGWGLRELVEDEAEGHKIHRAVAHGQCLRIAVHPIHPPRSPTCLLLTALGNGQEVRGEVETSNAGLWPLLCNVLSADAYAATNIEDVVDLHLVGVTVVLDGIQISLAQPLLCCATFQGPRLYFILPDPQTHAHCSGLALKGR